MKTATQLLVVLAASPELNSDRRRLDGFRRYAVSRKWRVETLEHRDCSPSSRREALSRLHPVGCAAECWCPETALRPALSVLA